MTRLNKIELQSAEGKAKELLESVHGKYGMVPNILNHMANSPAALEAYLNFSGALAGSSISAQLREQIALITAEINGCGYCASAHSAMAKMQGLSDEEILDARNGTSTDSKAEAALDFAQAILEKKGFVSDVELDKVRQAGYTDGEITEIIAVVSLNTYTNFFNHVAETEIDFPKVPELTKA